MKLVTKPLIVTYPSEEKPHELYDQALSHDFQFKLRNHIGRFFVVINIMIYTENFTVFTNF